MKTLAMTRDMIEAMNGLQCHIFNSAGSKLLAHGIFTARHRYDFLSNFQGIMPTPEMSNKDDDECRLALKQVTKELDDGVYKVSVLTKYEGAYVILESPDLNWENKNGFLESRVSLQALGIRTISEEEYMEISSMTYEFDWSKLIIPTGCSGTGQADAFEDLINEIILSESNGVVNYGRIGTGVDRARDGQFEIDMASWLPKVNATTRWILQCKYSVDKNTSLKIDEIYSEMIKVLMHKPDYYLLVTNRKITSDFIDWFQSDLMSNTNYYIPYKKY